MTPLAPMPLLVSPAAASTGVLVAAAVLIGLGALLVLGRGLWRARADGRGDRGQGVDPDDLEETDDPEQP